MNRLETGIPGLDALALGGLPEGRVTLVSGTTGSGKTVFGLQFLAAGVMSFGQSGVMVTLEEPPGPLIADTQGFEWDLGPLVNGGRIAVIDAADSLDGIVSGRFDFRGLSARIAHAVATTGAKRLVLDPLDALLLGFDDTNAARRALSEMIRELHSLGVTTVMTAERVADSGPLASFSTEEFVADNVVVLRNTLEAERRRRTLEVLKFRGCTHRKGEFPFVIDPSRGIEVVPFSVIEGESGAASERISLGEAKLDEMCGGGVYRDSVILVTGATGTGKTLLGAAFLQAGIDAGERGLFLSFEESASQLVRNVRSWGLDFEALEHDERLRVASRYPERMGLEDLLVAIKRDVEEFRPARVVIDSMTALEHNSPPRAFREFAVGVSGYLKRQGISVLLTTTLSLLLGGETATGVYLSSVADSIIALRYLDLESELRRGILIVKLRGQTHHRAIHEYEITDRGLRILSPYRGVVGILSGEAGFVATRERGRGEPDGR